MELRFVLYGLAFGAGLLTVRLWRAGASHDPSRFLHAALATLLCVVVLPWADQSAVVLGALGGALVLLVGPPLALRWAGSGAAQHSVADWVVIALWWGRSARALVAAARSRRALVRGDEVAAGRLVEPWLDAELPSSYALQVSVAAANVELAAGRWTAVVRRTDSLPAVPAVALARARALAELGRAAHCFDLLERVLRHPMAVHFGSNVLHAELAALAVQGRLEAMEMAFRRTAPAPEPLSAGWKAYWTGRALWARGDDTARQWLARAETELAARAPLASRRCARILAGHEVQVVSQPSPTANTAYRRYRRAVDEVAGWFRFSGAGPTAYVTLLSAMALLLAMLPYLDDVAARDAWIRAWGSRGPNIFEGGEWYRLFTANVAHANATHVSVNAWALLLFGAPVERVWGRWVVAAGLLLSGVSGHWLSAWWDGSPHRVSVGASTAVYGVLAMYCWVLIEVRVRGMERYFRARILFLVALVMADFAVAASSPVIDTTGHLGGLIAGVLLGGAVFWARRARQNRLSSEYSTQPSVGSP